MPCTEINNAINWSKQSTGTKTFPVTAYFTKHFGKVTAAALLALAGASASAAALGPLDLSSGSTGFSNTPIAGDFIDTYTFTLTRPTFLAGSVTSVVGGIQNVDFSDIRIVGQNGSINFTKVNPDPFEFWVTTPFPGLRSARRRLHPAAPRHQQPRYGLLRRQHRA